MGFCGGEELARGSRELSKADAGPARFRACFSTTGALVPKAKITSQPGVEGGQFGERRRKLKKQEARKHYL